MGSKATVVTGADPDVLVIGAMRAGTTSVQALLGAHPEVFVSAVKEPHRFAFTRLPRHTGPGDRAFDDQLVLDPDEYRALFAPGAGLTHRAEASAMYLYVPGTAARIDEALTDVRLIAILRDPAQRAYSSWVYQRMRMFEPIDDFEAALDAEDDRVARGWNPIWHYRRAGRYGEQLAPYLERFGDRLLVAFFEEVRADEAAFVDQVADFLGVDRGGFPQGMPSTNASGMPRNRVLQRALQVRPPWFGILRRILPPRLVDTGRALRARNTSPAPALEPTLAARLRRDATSDVARLEELLGRPVPAAWRT